MKNTVEKIEAAAPSDAKLTKIPFSTVDLLTVHTGAVGGSKNPGGSSKVVGIMGKNPLKRWLTDLSKSMGALAPPTSGAPTGLRFCVMVRQGCFKADTLVK